MEKIPKLTRQDRKELEEEKKRIFEERMRFIDLYTDWLKKTPNKAWSRQQKVLLDQ